MAFVSVNPTSGSVVATGDTITVTWDTAVYPTITYRPSTGTWEPVSSLSGSTMVFGAGFTGEFADQGGGVWTTTFRRNAGWANSPFTIAIQDTVLSSETQVNYTLLAEGQYPPDMQPFGDPGDYDAATGSAIEVEYPPATSLTTDVTKFIYEGSGVTVVESAEDEVTVTIPGGGFSTLDEVLTGGTTDNDVTLNNGDGIILRDGGLGTIPLQVATTYGGNLLDAISVSTATPTKGISVHDSDSGTTMAPEGIFFQQSGDVATPTYRIQPTQKDSDVAPGNAVLMAGGENVGTAGGGAIIIRGGAASGGGANGPISVGDSFTSSLSLGGVGASLYLHDGVDVGTHGYVVTNVSGAVRWAPSQAGGGGDTDTVAGSLGITNTGDNVDAILTPTYGSVGNTICQGNDSRLSNSRDPNTHASSHENGNGDEISVAGLSGLLADPQSVGIEDGGTPDTYDATTINFGTNLSVTVDAEDGTATVNASATGTVGVHGFGSWNYDNTLTEADPGSGNFRLDALNPTAATYLYINYTNGDSQSQLDTLPYVDGWRLVFNNAAGAKWFNATCGTVAVGSGGGFYKIPITAVGTTSLTNTENYSVTIAASEGFPVLDQGETIGDNVIVRGNGGDRRVQDSGWDITDGGLLRGNSAGAGIRMDQRATGPTFENDKGLWWAKDDTSTTLPMFTSGDGTEIDLSAAVSGDGIDTSALHDDGNTEISAMTQKSVPIGADMLVIEDSVSGDSQYIEIGDLPLIAADAESLVANARSSGGTINPGQVVYVTGWNATAGVIEVDLADATSASTMPGYGIANETITSAATGQVIVSGEIGSQVTNSYSEGDLLYVSETAGGLTDTAPAVPALIQSIGIVNRSDLTVGSIQVIGAGVVTAHTQLDTHIADTSNPHGTDLANLGAGTLALLNLKIADRDLVADAATLDALAGAAGATPFGSWTFDTGTSGDPGAGGFRITHPTATGSTTELYVSATDAVGIVHVLDDIWATDSQLYINQGVEAMTCVVTSITDETGWYTVAVNTVVVSADTSWTDTANFLILASAGAAGGGDVSATGSPSDEEIAVWTDGTTIEGRTGTSVTALLAAATTTTAGIVELATDGEDAADKVVQGNDARLDAFTTSQDGLVPQSGASTALYLQGDGTWSDPSAGSGHGTTNSIDDHSDVDIVTDAVSEGEVLVWRTDEFVPEPPGGGGGSGDKTLASNVTADLDATEIVVGGAYIDGSTGGTYSWEMLGTYNDNGGTGNQDIELRLYDRGPDGTPVAGVLRSVIEITSLDTLDRVTQSLTASGSPGVDADEIFNTARMYEVRAYMDAAGAVDTARILSCVFIEA